MLNKKFLIVSALVLLVILIGVYFYLKINKQKETQPAVLTQEEKMAILNELNAGAKTNPLTDKEKKEILKDLDSGASKTPLTEEERIAILTSLSNPQ